MTTVAPLARSAIASRVIAGASGANVRPTTLAPIVWARVSIVVTPTSPTFTPRTFTMVEGLTLGHATGLPVESSMVLAVRRMRRC
ncbi:MAG: hypothetical protein DMF88_08045 [Acidobacteria bacterium]|nr:MAG: hypothetical protein DMF88_08045 [Acidobacteriota bacterium]